MTLTTIKSFFRRDNKLLIPIIIISLSVVVLGVSSQIILQSFLKNIKTGDGYLLLTRKQRALSQEIIKEVVADDWAGLSPQESIDSMFNIATQQNIMLYAGDENLKVDPIPRELIPVYSVMNSAFKDFKKTLDERNEEHKNTAVSFLNLLTKQQEYSRKIDDFANAIHEYTKKKLDSFYIKAAIIAAIRVIIIALEVFLIFLPAVKKIQQQNKKLRAIAYHQSHVLRSPLCSIIGTLSLMADAEVDGKLKELVDMATEEAERLDNIIKKTVSLTCEQQK
jgi:signal transduction histidine kinase